jgi:hypothetical protein
VPLLRVTRNSLPAGFSDVGSIVSTRTAPGWMGQTWRTRPDPSRTLREKALPQAKRCRNVVVRHSIDV